MIDIKKLKEKVGEYEAQILSHLFNIDYKKAEELLNFGFKYNYEHNYFHTEIIINNIIHKVELRFIILEKERLVRFYVSFSDIDSRRFKKLDGTHYGFYLYHNIGEKFHFLNTKAIFTYIYTVYRLNQKDELESFKTFVSNEKELDKENIT